MAPQLKQRTPASRLNKKQIIAYIPSDLASAVRRHVESEGITNNECVGRALNEALDELGKRPVLSLVHLRSIRRNKGKASRRTTTDTPACRRNKVTIGGWFDSEEVERAKTISKEIQVPLQVLVETGLRKITAHTVH